MVEGWNEELWTDLSWCEGPRLHQTKMHWNALEWWKKLIGWSRDRPTNKMADGNIRTENGGTENWFEEKNVLEEVKLKKNFFPSWLDFYEDLWASLSQKVCAVGVFCGNIIQNLDLVLFLWWKYMWVFLSCNLCACLR